MQGDDNQPFASSSANVSKISAAGYENNTSQSSNQRLQENKLVTLRRLLESDLPSADVKWSLFVAACQSYRYDSCLKPFPPLFMKGDTKDIDGLREVVDKTPALPVLLQHLHDPDVYHTNPVVIDLLTWVLAHFKDYHLKSVQKKEFNLVLNQVHCETPVQPPNFIFQLNSTSNSVQEIRWEDLRKGRKTLFAFHGSRLENFHSILHHGLQQHLTKNALFGRGIYLSSELSVSLPYSPMGYGWGRSLLGDQMSCVALCEMIDHPDVKCQSEASDKNRALNTDSIGGEVPKKYYVVVNSDLVRVRHLLVYCRRTSGKRYTSCILLLNRERSSSLLNWLGNHKLLTFILGYIVLLASVGLSNNHYVQRYYKMLLHRAGY
ncbi:Protein mono-ADP-ribosyltransferase PARP16 [Gryllus bimaculatus]|nr:Protein mono-ADP-ribosyltransferase PARP16 [Gryllus bimaculatus]